MDDLLMYWSQLAAFIERGKQFLEKQPKTEYTDGQIKGYEIILKEMGNIEKELNL